MNHPAPHHHFCGGAIEAAVSLHQPQSEQHTTVSRDIFDYFWFILPQFYTKLVYRTFLHAVKCGFKLCIKHNYLSIKIVSKVADSESKRLTKTNQGYNHEKKS